MSYMGKNEKQKHTILTEVEKAEIIKKVDEEEKFSDVASFDGVSNPTNPGLIYLYVRLNSTVLTCKYFSETLDI